jgi:hypothetical protein
MCEHPDQLIIWKLFIYLYALVSLTYIWHGKPTACELRRFSSSLHKVSQFFKHII